MNALAERMDRLFAAAPFGVYIADANLISHHELMQLAKSRPGSIIAMEHPEAIRYLPTEDSPTFGCIAGWISDEDLSHG